jgi:hypothetical protein
LWVVWIEQSHQGDQVIAQEFTEGQESDFKVLSSYRGIEFQPSVATYRNGSAVVAWIAFRNDKWYVISRHIEGDSIGDEVIIASNNDGLFRPRMILDKDEKLWIICETVQGKATQLLVCSFFEGHWGKPWKLPTPDLSNCFRPNLSIGPYEGVWVAYDIYKNSSYDIILQRIDKLSDPVSVISNGYNNLHNAITSDKSGDLWIAWASNQNDAHRDPWWLTKWVYINQFDGKSIKEPCGDPPGKDIYNNSPFQGWEFPAVIVDQVGRVWIFGQSSHTHYAQYYAGAEWSPLYTISPRYWGSWKPRFRAVQSGEFIYLAAMGLQGAQLQRINILPTKYHPVVIRSQKSCLDANVDKKTPSRTSLKSKSGQTLNIYFGDLHCHGTYSDGEGDIDEIYHRYRDGYHYDFASLTEHDYVDGLELSLSEYKMITNYAERFNSPGVFVTFTAYEWTSPAIAEHASNDQVVGEGHKNIYFPDGKIRLESYGEIQSGEKLLKKFKGEDVLIISHHTGWSGTDWEIYDEELQPLIEICSTHGRFEYPGNQPIGHRRDHVHLGKFVLDALDKGYKFGFVGGSDSHGTKWHHTEIEGRDSNVPTGTVVGWKRDAYRTGMTAILAEDLTRASLYKALKKRLCYATSGVPIIIDFRINDELMGSNIRVDAQPTISAYVNATDTIRSIDIVRSGRVFSGLQAHEGEGIMSIQLNLIDKYINHGETHYYYLRVSQEDGNMAWSSPIWVTFP